MPSLFWDILHEDSPEYNYEYEVQNQFVREADNLLGEFRTELDSFNLKFLKEDMDMDKAIWMLQNDAVSSAQECLDALKEKKHRIAGKQFRPIIETLDLAAYFHSNTEQSKDKLTKWFKNETIPHRISREYIGKIKGKDKKTEIAKEYDMLSKFLHRTYNILLYGYVLGREEKLSYDDRDSDLLVPMTTISIYMSLLAHTIKILSWELSLRGLIKNKRVKEIWNESMEKETVPKKYAMPKDILQRAIDEGKIEEK